MNGDVLGHLLVPEDSHWLKDLNGTVQISVALFVYKVTALVMWLVLVRVIMHSVANSHWDSVCLVRSELFTAVVMPVIALWTDTSS
jgi:hypothetical protein